MIKLDPIIAVQDVNKSSAWYEAVFDCRRTHGGNEFAVLEDKNEAILICLHKWGEHEHPNMKNPDISIGNGLILYFKTDCLAEIYQVVKQMNYPVSEEMHLNANSMKKEFSLRDLDGYYLTITEYHSYKG